MTFRKNELIECRYRNKYRMGIIERVHKPNVTVRLLQNGNDRVTDRLVYRTFNIYRMRNIRRITT